MESTIIEVPEGPFDDSVGVIFKAVRGRGEQIEARSVALLTHRQLAWLDAIEQVENRFKASGP